MLVLTHVAGFVDEHVHPSRGVESLEINAIAERERAVAEAEQARTAFDDPDRREVERPAVDAPQSRRLVVAERPRLRLQPHRRLHRPPRPAGRRDGRPDQLFDHASHGPSLLIKAAIAASPLVSSADAIRSRTSAGLSWSTLAVPRQAVARSSNPAMAVNSPS